MIGEFQAGKSPLSSATTILFGETTNQLTSSSGCSSCRSGIIVVMLSRGDRLEFYSS
jgi:hypothetical protein